LRPPRPLPYFLSPLLSLLPLGVLVGLLLPGGPLMPAGGGTARAANRIEGYYEAEIAMERQDSRWHFGPPSSNNLPRHYAELKFFSWPSDALECYLKLRAESNRDDDRTPRPDYVAPPWLDYEGHIRLRGERYEGRLFSRQNYFYLNDEPLLKLVEDYKLKNDDWGPKAQGVVVNFWDVGSRNAGLGGTVIYSDNGGTQPSDRGDLPLGDNGLIIRLRPHFLDSQFGDHGDWGQIFSGITILRKDWTTSGSDSEDLRGLMYNTVYSFDLAYSPAGLKETGLYLGPLNLEQSRWTIECAKSETPYELHALDHSDDNTYAFAAEVRDIQISNLMAHAWHFDFGENFRDYLSGRFDSDRHEYNRVQNHAELIWLVPRKAVTAKLVYDHHRKRISDETDGTLRPATEWYGELYMEFINGFKGRVAYKHYHGFDDSSEIYDFYTYPEWFGELSVENFLAKIRLQMRVRDAGTFRQLMAYGFDMNVNISERLKGYLRMLNVDEQTEARHTMFAQLRYELGMGAECYFEYGDPGQSDNIVYTDGFVNEGSGDNLRDRLKLFLKAWF
jgi:hypothetical protein